MAPRVDIITIGNVCVDIYIPPHTPPPPGGITTIPSLALVPGGNAANTAITARRLGLPAAVAGVLGDDPLGRYLLEFLRKEGVMTDWLSLLPGRASPATLVQNDAAGERSFVHHPGTNTDFRLPEEALEAPCRILHFAGAELLGSFWPSGAIEAARRFRRSGRILSSDPFAVDGPRAASLAAEHEPFLALMDIVLPNEGEARLVTGRKDLREAIRHFHALGVGIVAIKRGAEGALVSWDGNVEEVRAARAAVVDTCGAGDSFSAGFLAGRLRGLDPADCARVGCALGTLCVGHQGAITGSSDPARLAAALAGLGI